MNELVQVLGLLTLVFSAVGIIIGFTWLFGTIGNISDRTKRIEERLGAASDNQPAEKSKKP